VLFKVLIIQIDELIDSKCLPKFKSSVNDDLSVGKYDIPYLPMQPINLGLLQPIIKDISIFWNMRAYLQNNTASYPRTD
jgi:hypothetical protein